MKLILSHPTGNAFVRAAAEGFFKADVLLEFHTSIASFSGSLLDRLGAIGSLSDIRRRRFHSQLQPFTHTWPWIEAGRMAASKAGFGKLIRHEKGVFCMDAVYQHLDKKVASHMGRWLK